MSYQVLILRPLGSGGYGNLFVGQRSDTGARVVVKYLRDYWIPHQRKAFTREVRLLQRRLHGMIPLLFANTTSERPYYVMPYMNGGTLTAFAGKLAVAKLDMVALELAQTLATLHSAFEAHGDFKPDNIVVSRDGKIQVADPLGNGSIFTMLFSENRGGTPGYCAPEIRLSGGSISREADVYSYGATLYHLLTGERPGDGQRLDNRLEAYGHAGKICEIIRACCQRAPGSRPTMQEVLQMLHGVQWMDIQAARMKQQEFVKGVCFVAVCVGLLAIIS